MKLVNNNLSPLPFYDDISQQNHRKDYAFGKVWPLITYANYLLPFQILLPDSFKQLNHVRLYNYNTGQYKDITLVMTLAGLVLVKVDGYSILKYPGNKPVEDVPGSEFTDIIKEGLYYIALICNDGDFTLYSEVFSVTNRINDYLRIDYGNSYNFTLKDGVVDFSDNFAFRCYLPTQVGKPEYVFEEEAEERLGYNFIESQVSKKIYKFTFFAPEYLCDALRLIRLCNYKKIYSKGQTYDLSAFEMDVEWEEQGDLAAVECSFETDTVIANIGGMINTGYNPELPEPDEPDEPEKPEPSEYTVNITVKDSYTNEPLKDIVLAVYDVSSGIIGPGNLIAETVSDAEGKGTLQFSMEDIPSGMALSFEPGAYIASGEFINDETLYHALIAYPTGTYKVEAPIKDDAAEGQDIYLFTFNELGGTAIQVGGGSTGLTIEGSPKYLEIVVSTVLVDYDRFGEIKVIKDGDASTDTPVLEIVARNSFYETEHVPFAGQSSLEIALNDLFDYEFYWEDLTIPATENTDKVSVQELQERNICVVFYYIIENFYKAGIKLGPLYPDENGHIRIPHDFFTADNPDEVAIQVGGDSWSVMQNFYNLEAPNPGTYNIGGYASIVYGDGIQSLISQTKDSAGQNSGNINYNVIPQIYRKIFLRKTPVLTTEDGEPIIFDFPGGITEKFMPYNQIPIDFNKFKGYGGIHESTIIDDNNFGI